MLMLVRRLAAIIAVVVAATGAVAAPRNVVLFVTDDQGQDAGCYGNPVIKTPSLDALAADGTRFTYAYCTTASCSPSRAVILTGIHSHANGQYGLAHASHHFRTFENLKTLPVLLSEAGYRTARIGKFHVAPEETYRFDEKLSANPRSAVEMAERCRAVIEADSDRPFFLYFCTTDPHRSGRANDLPHKPDTFGNKPHGKNYPGVEPVRYDPDEVIVPPFLPDTPACRAELAQYYESVSRADAGLGRLVEILQSAGRYDDTLILYISDNGMPFPGAKTTVYEPGLRLPCVVRNPEVETKGVVSEAFVSWVDIMPTILDFANVELPDHRQRHGRSFLPILHDEDPAGWDEFYASHTFHEITMYYPMRVVRSGRHKLIYNVAHPLPFPLASDLWKSATWQGAWSRGKDFEYGKRTIETFVNRPQFELYDLEDDPHETKNLAASPEHQERLASLKQKLRKFQQRTDDPWLLKWDRE